MYNESMEKANPKQFFYTVGESKGLEGGFRRNCGPVAVTNLLCTLLAKQKRQTNPPAEVFLQVAHLGMRRLVYWNMDLFGLLGGTSDILAGWYIRRCLKAFGLENSVDLGRRQAPTREMLREAAEKGSMLYLQLMGHPRYGRHHLLCYEVKEEEGEWRFRVADGWNRMPLALSLEALGRVRCIEIRPRTWGNIQADALSESGGKGYNT